MNPTRLCLSVLAIGIALATALTAVAATVKITPLGSHDGEFCRFDRAMIKVPVYVPLSGRTLAFDGNGTCVSGC